MQPNYWSRLLESRRLSRRRAIAGFGGTAAGAAFLAACGGDDEPSAVNGDTNGNGNGNGTTQNGSESSLLTQPEDTSAQAVRGGTLKRHVDNEFASLDPNLAFRGAAVLHEPVHGRLVGWEPAQGRAAQEHEYTGDAAEEWETSPDGTRITFKLRPGVRFHDVPPVNGREMDTDDVLFSWERFAEVGGARTTLVNALNPGAPVISVESPDASTIVVELAYPLVYALGLFGHRYNVNLIPKEAENPSVVDVRDTMISIGPYYLSDFQPSIGYTLRRHEGYWDQSHSFVDQVDYPIIGEYSSAVAQFRAGEIHHYPPMQQEEILPIKEAIPELNLIQGDFLAVGPRTIFGWQTPELRDERVRQAISMSMNRDQWIDVFNNVPDMEAAGIPMERRWFGSFPTITEGFDGWNIDPRNEADLFGENAKYFQHNVEEARALLDAAGHGDGLELYSNFVAGAQYGIDHPRHVEVLNGFMRQAGITFESRPLDYSSEFIPNYRDSNGQFDGISYRLGPPPASADPIAQMHYWYHSGAGVSFFGQDAGGAGDGSGDPYVDETIDKAQGEFDTEARRELLHDLIRYLGEKIYGIQGLGASNSLLLAWPALPNFYAWRGSSVSNERVYNVYNWVDETKAPYA